MDVKKYLDDLKEYGIENSIPNISQLNAAFLGQLIALKTPQRILEIGMANGYSTIHFALRAQKYSGKIVSIEFSPNSHAQALTHFSNLGLNDVITPILGNALDLLPTLDGPFEFVFIDGMKKRSRDFLELVWEKVPEGGIIVIDDVIKFHDKMVGLWEYLEDRKISHTILPIDGDDGILLIVKE